MDFEIGGIGELTQALGFPYIKGEGGLIGFGKEFLPFFGNEIINAFAELIVPGNNFDFTICFLKKIAQAFNGTIDGFNGFRFAVLVKGNIDFPLRLGQFFEGRD